jgi:hypothetical protein
MRAGFGLCSAAFVFIGCGYGLDARLDSAALRVSVAQIPAEVRALEVVATRYSDGAQVARAPAVDPGGALTVYFDRLDAGYYALTVRGLDAGQALAWCAGRAEVELTGAGTAIAIELIGLDALDCTSLEPFGDQGDEGGERPPPEDQVEEEPGDDHGGDEQGEDGERD